jgi:hypothetical protein
MQLSFISSPHLILQHQQSFAPPLTQILDHIQVSIVAGSVKARLPVLLRQSYGCQIHSWKLTCFCVFYLCLALSPMCVIQASSTTPLKQIVMVRDCMLSSLVGVKKKSSIQALTLLVSISRVSPPTSHRYLTTFKCPLVQAQ